MYMSKLEKHLWRGLIRESFGITYHSLFKMKQKKSKQKRMPNISNKLF